MQSVAVWIQAIATTLVAAVTLWVVFFSEVGELAIELLRADLLEARKEMQELSEEKKRILQVKQQLETQYLELERQREEHVTHVVNGYLRELWEVGLRRLTAYRDLAIIGQELRGESEKFSPLRNWESNLDEVIPLEIWRRYLPNPNNIHEEKRTEWGELLIDWSGDWKCSKRRPDISEVYDDIPFDLQGTKVGTKGRAILVGEWQSNIQLEYRKRLVSYNILCYDEWERAVRQKISGTNEIEALSLREFSQRLLLWSGLGNLSQEVIRKIEEKMMDEISINRQLSNLTVQLKVPKTSSLEMIEKQADKIRVNVKIAKDWLDNATKDRHRWGAE